MPMLYAYAHLSYVCYEICYVSDVQKVMLRKKGLRESCLETMIEFTLPFGPTRGT